MALSTLPPEFDVLAKLRTADETIAIDLAKIPDTGLELSWLPLSLTAAAMFWAPGPGSVLPVCSTYVMPTYQDFSSDSYVYIWVEAESGDVVDILAENTINYEAVPFSGTEFLFDRESVSGSPGDIAAAYQMAGQQNNTNALWSNLADSAPTKESAARSAGGRGPPSSSSSEGGGLMSVAKGALSSLGSQIPAPLQSIAGGLLDSIFGSSLKQHQASCALGMSGFSPVVTKTTYKDTRCFLVAALAHYDALQLAKTQNTKPAAKEECKEVAPVQQVATPTPGALSSAPLPPPPEAVGAPPVVVQHCVCQNCHKVGPG